MEQEKQAVRAAFQAMQQAMIDKDIEKMRSLVAEDKTFRHMSGKVQTREEFFEEIRNGTLNYYGYTIRNEQIEVQENTARYSADVTLRAKVYGFSGSWTLHTKTNYLKKDGHWIQCN
ncbi:MAG: nuclear transport factor 2 family protein [Erysipelotrichaceae bacterium]|nr:nuclear transport factor 2 family protein [Erysipelotrichaceae bacterium]